jgi:hypothetical protein
MPLSYQAGADGQSYRDHWYNGQLVQLQFTISIRKKETPTKGSASCNHANKIAVSQSLDAGGEFHSIRVRAFYKRETVVDRLDFTPQGAR